jgi:phosphoribosylamine--glycine ligase
MNIDRESDSMKALIVGGGGREHAIAWKLAQSPRLTKLYCAPGNPGIAQVAELVNLKIHPDFGELVHWCRATGIDLVVVGPERPLAEGIVDALAAAGIKAFGPTRAGAMLESSKRFAKELMLEAGIPTGAARWFGDLDEATAYLKSLKPPYVIKAAGLAEGKGVTVARDMESAQAALRECLAEGRFGEAGAEVLIEEFLEGEEASLLAFADGKLVRAMDSAQDHKPVFDGDEGPNTGGMGAYSPAPVVDAAMRERCAREVLQPCLEALRRRGIDYRGIIYAGLMITAQGPKVIEFNCRFGDPETQALLPRLDGDLLEIMLACAEGRLEEVAFGWREETAICVVAASGGYPGAYAKGKVIHGLEKLPTNGDVMVFHAGTALNAQGQVVTAGGRVLGLTVRDPFVKVAYERAYDLMDMIRFDGMHCRHDIGLKALKRLKR